MNIQAIDGLPFVQAIVQIGDQSFTFEHALLDSGSAGTLFSADILNITPSKNALIREMVGIGGGTEFVVEFEVDVVRIGDLKVENFRIQKGNTNYGYSLDAIIGFDFLKAVGAIINLDQMKIASAEL